MSGRIGSLMGYYELNQLNGFVLSVWTPCQPSEMITFYSHFTHLGIAVEALFCLPFMCAVLTPDFDYLSITGLAGVLQLIKQCTLCFQICVISWYHSNQGVPSVFL